MIPWTVVTVILKLFILIDLVFSGTSHPRIHQPDEVITVELGNTVTLQCNSNKDNVFWYKQIAGQSPRVIAAFGKFSEPRFYNEFRNSRFWGKRLRSISNLTISDIIQSDEGMYFCVSKAFYCEFGNGTQLIIKDPHNSTSQISSSDSMKCQCNENSTKHVKKAEDLYPAVLGLACALGLCGVLVFSLIAFIFRRVGVSEQDNQIRGHSSAQDTDDEKYVTYSALRFNRKN